MFLIIQSGCLEFLTKGVISLSEKTTGILIVWPTNFAALSKGWHIKEDDLILYLNYLILNFLHGELPAVRQNDYHLTFAKMDITNQDNADILATHCPVEMVENLIIFVPILDLDYQSQRSVPSDLIYHYQVIIDYLTEICVSDRIVLIREDIDFDPDNFDSMFLYNNKKNVMAVRNF